MIVLRYLAIALLTVYAAALVVGYYPIMKVTGLAVVVIMMMCWFRNRLTVTTDHHELFIIPIILAGNVILLLSTELDLFIKIVYSSTISVALLIDMVLYIRKTRRASTMSHLQ